MEAKALLQMLLLVKESSELDPLIDGISTRGSPASARKKRPRFRKSVKNMGMPVRDREPPQETRTHIQVSSNNLALIAPTVGLLFASELLTGKKLHYLQLTANSMQLSVKELPGSVVMLWALDGEETIKVLRTWLTNRKGADWGDPPNAPKERLLRGWTIASVEDEPGLLMRTTWLVQEGLQDGISDSRAAA